MVRERVLKKRWVLGVTTSLLVGLAVAQTRSFDIAAGDLKTALDAYTRQSGIQIIYDTDELRGKRSAGVHGSFSAEEALHQLLSGTGLEVQRDSSGAVAIHAGAARSKQTRARSRAQGGSQETAGYGDLVPDEVIVTAQKKEERLQDVPLSVSVVDTQVLAANGQNRLADYYASVPGLIVTSLGQGSQEVNIRGINTSYSSNPTVRTAIDGVPIGSSVGFTNGGIYGTPDLDPSDLARVEVLKGPQGTLYGADSLGGLINFVSEEPSTKLLSGHISLDASNIPNGSSGYGVHAGVNVPVSDNFAIRASAFTRHDPGFIDSLVTGEKNINSANVYGSRVAGLWNITDHVSLNISALMQNDRGEGASQIDPTPDLDLSRTALPSSGGYKFDTRQYTATLSAKVASFNVTSVTGYGDIKFSGSQDISGFIATVDPPATGGTQVQNDEYKKFTQELRLSFPVGINWTGLPVRSTRMKTCLSMCL